MKWYAASLVSLIRFKDGKQNKFPIWENVLLVKAKTPGAALKKAMRLGKKYNGDAMGTLSYEGRAAREEFQGVRKVIECVFPEIAPGDGTEITYSRFFLPDKKAVKAMIEGKAVQAKYFE